MEFPVMTERIVVIADNPRDPALRKQVAGMQGEIIWLPITGEIAPPPAGSWYEDFSWLDKASIYQIRRESVSFSNNWYILDGRDITLTPEGISLGSMIGYHIQEILTPLLKMIKVLDSLKPNRVIILDTDTKFARLGKVWSSTRKVDIKKVKPSGINHPDRSFGLRRLDLKRKFLQNIIRIVAGVKLFLFPPGRKSTGVFSLTPDATKRICKGITHDLPDCHLILPMEMFTPKDLFNPGIYWLEVTAEFIPEKPSKSLNKLFKEIDASSNFIFDGLNLWPLVKTQLQDILTAWDDVIDKLIRKERIMERLKRLNAKYYFTGQDFTWENRLFAALFRKEKIRSFLIQHGACTQDTKDLNGCLPSSYCEKALIWGQSSKALYEISGFSSRDIIIWGNPHFYGYQKIAEKGQLRENARARLGISQDERVILFIPPVYVSFYPELDPRRINLEFAQVCRGFGNVPEVRLIIRYHPSISYYENKGLKRDIARNEGPANLIEDPGLSILEAISCADAVMGANSTTLIEGLMMDKIILEDSDYGGFLNMASSGAALPYRSEEKSVADALHKYLHLSDLDREILKKGGEKYLANSISSSGIDIKELLNEQIQL
jgi:hypothetical protein